MNKAGLEEDGLPADPDNTNNVPPPNSRSNSSASNKKTKQQKVTKSLRNKVYRQSASLDRKEIAIDELQKNVVNLKEESKMLALLEASAQMRAVELKASADKAYGLLTDRTVRFTTYRAKTAHQLKQQRERAKKKVGEMEATKSRAVAKAVALSEMKTENKLLKASCGMPSP